MFNRNYNQLSFNDKAKFQKKKLKMKKNAMDPVDFEEEKRKDPKYKTELCKSFMETHFCVYGNKCRFAHGYKELVVKTQINNYKKKYCNSFFKFGYCPYGNRCNFRHDQRQLNEMNIPYYESNLICAHFLRLKTCQRLPVFNNITMEHQNFLIKLRNQFNNNFVYIRRNNNNNSVNNTANNSNSNKIENEKIINNSFYNNESSFSFDQEFEEEEEKKGLNLSSSLSDLSEKSSEASSLNNSPNKKHKKFEYCFENPLDCLPKELNFDINFFECDEK